MKMQQNKKLTKGQINCLYQALYNADERDDDYGKGNYWYVPSGGAIKACNKLAEIGLLTCCWTEVQMEIIDILKD